LPIALSLGAASTSRVPLGIVVVGGIIFSLILTLFVIPAMYSFLSKKRKHITSEVTPVVHHTTDTNVVPATGNENGTDVVKANNI
jgi:hypothetical protein